MASALVLKFSAFCVFSFFFFFFLFVLFFAWFFQKHYSSVLLSINKLQNAFCVPRSYCRLSKVKKWSLFYTETFRVSPPISRFYRDYSCIFAFNKRKKSSCSRLPRRKRRLWKTSSSPTIAMFGIVCLNSSKDHFETNTSSYKWRKIKPRKAENCPTAMTIIPMDGLPISQHNTLFFCGIFWHDMILSTVLKRWFSWVDCKECGVAHGRTVFGPFSPCLPIRNALGYGRPNLRRRENHLPSAQRKPCSQN